MALFFAVAVLTTALVATPIKHKTVTSQTASRKPAQARLVAVRHTRSGVHTVKSRSRKRLTHVAPAPTYQLHPDPERYQQIQQALTDRGYFKGQINGSWGDDSVDALKRFQTDQKMLDADGKINALSLTGLGLGPRHDGTTASTVPLSATNASPLDPPLELPTTPLLFDLPIPPPALNPHP